MTASLPTRSPPEWQGDPIGQYNEQVRKNQTKTHASYAAVRVNSVTVSIGDFVKVNLLHGIRICLVLMLWEDRKTDRPVTCMAKVMCFADGEDSELLMTTREVEVKVDRIHHKVQVLSYKAYHKANQSEDHTIYYCQRGVEERLSCMTKAIDLDKVFSNSDPGSLLKLARRLIEEALENDKSTRKVRMAKNTTRTSRTAFKNVDDTYSASSSEFEDASTSAAETSEDDLAPITPRKRKRTNVITPKSERVRTPGSRSHRIMAPLEVEPLPSRTARAEDEQNLTPHQLARQRLHVAEVPVSLPCRESEFANIYTQVESAIIDNDSALLYISGTPGAGKTATVREVVAALQESVRNKELYPFKFVEINGMKIPDPAQAYARLWESLTGQRVTAQHALSLLQEYYSKENPTGMSCVVLMDELDQLTTTKQEVMYNFFQWPSMPNTRLIVIAVSNTMDLPERFLAHKVASRLGLSRIAFPSYTREQLNKIITSRLQSVSGMEIDAAAIDFACLKVASVSGDARRALDICRRAFELAEAQLTAQNDGDSGSRGRSDNISQPVASAGRITMQVIREAIRLMTTSPLQNYLTALPLLAKLFLKALLACVRRSGLAENTLGDITEDASRLCKVNTRRELELIMGNTGLQPYAMMETARSLSTAGIIYLESFVSEKHCRVRLKIPESDLVGFVETDADVRTIT
ncbi:P-loop containing nucleoside triphosphate hydrolase protein [Protomyces lactucae-debilis]|uniref:Origin recognition complex subunit 1 n=1 Tax=Protomyces lactucae-debilis TaxID=2754530 RepID=A0A1Y2FT16_PROLT|nr:P-loop containing nucleoside triphosphate hydrolase protein [Protomyces lactucae-debilis]ORY87151.1 P-loop containing nucleoside triphosphate hydrolase protein [Protomyces lactucae-debilis]